MLGAPVDEKIADARFQSLRSLETWFGLTTSVQDNALRKPYISKCSRSAKSEDRGRNPEIEADAEGDTGMKRCHGLQARA